MKKTIVTILVLCLSLTLMSGCGNKNASGDASSGEGTADGGLDYNVDDYVTLSEYTGLSGYNVVCTADDDEVQEEIDSDLMEHATYTDITDRTAEDGDYVTLDYSASVDGEEVEDCSETDYELMIGDGMLGDDIDDALVGHSAGDSFTVDAEIPEDISDTNGGDDAVFTITISKLQEENYPELDEDFVTTYTDYDTVDDYKAAKKEEVIQSKEEDYYEGVSADLLGTVMASATFSEDYPQELYDTCETGINESITSTAESWGLDEDTVRSLYGITDDNPIENVVLDEVHYRLVVYAIAQKESLFMTDDQYQEYAQSLADEYGYSSVEDLEEDAGKDAVEYEGIYENVVKFLYDNANLEDISEEDYDQLTASDGAEDVDEDDSVELDEDETEDETSDEDSVSADDEDIVIDADDAVESE